MVFSRGAINRINPFPSPFFSASTFIDKNDHFELLSTCFSCCINGDWGLLYYTTNCGIVLPINFTTLAHSLGSDGVPFCFLVSPFYIPLCSSLYVLQLLLVTDWGYEFRNFCSSSHPSSNSSMCFKILLVVVHFWFWFTFVKFDNLSLLLLFLLLRRGGGWKWNEILNFLVFVIPLVLLLFLLKLLMMKLWQNYFPPRENRLTNWI